MDLLMDTATVQKILLANISEVKKSPDHWRCEVRPMDATTSKNNYASFIYIAELINNDVSKSFSVVVKVMPDNIRMREIQNSRDQFYNEDVMFQQVFPVMIKYSGLCDKAAVVSLVPKCFYASHAPDSTVLVLENLTVDGYKLANFMLDYEHCRLAMEGLARYHALSYAMKHSHVDIFTKQVVGVVREARFNETFRSKYNNMFFQFFTTDPLRHIETSRDPELVAFRKKHAGFLKRLEEVLQDPVPLIESLMVPEEPLAVITHGDFNRNNLMYRYDDRGHPAQVKLLDFQTVRYANPATDFVFFVFFNMTADLRRERLDDLLRCYQKVLVDALVEATGQPREQLESVYSVQTFRDDFKRRAVYGYVISAMFIHFMLATPEELKVVEECWPEFPGDDEVPQEGYLRDIGKLGGDDAMGRSVAIIKDMAEMGCIVK